MNVAHGPAPRWLEAAAITLLLFSAMIEPRVTIALAVALIGVGLAAVALDGRSGRSGQHRS
jgi:hypothetical protein